MGQNRWHIVTTNLKYDWTAFLIIPESSKMRMSETCIFNSPLTHFRGVRFTFEREVRRYPKTLFGAKNVKSIRLQQYGLPVGRYRLPIQSRIVVRLLIRINRG